MTVRLDLCLNKDHRAPVEGNRTQSVLPQERTANLCTEIVAGQNLHTETNISEQKLNHLSNLCILGTNAG